MELLGRFSPDQSRPWAVTTVLINKYNETNTGQAGPGMQLRAVQSDRG